MCIYAKELAFHFTDTKFMAYALSFILLNLGFEGQAKSDLKASSYHPVPEFSYAIDGRGILQKTAITKDQSARVCNMLMSSATRPTQSTPDNDDLNFPALL